ncbi:YvcK family protein [Microbispora sp. NEAU-D428]|uniref:2-phospho-L-lactate transferase CofD family protein n=1 Tax=Microbispora sitophila TaxID=2771537 RepID=UPI001867A079|nr:2-phospho-L-lactate transferase CofD family protein [Microbispora sitophila]MBE3010578.1 YvcK family protein [Microbispora sitophila]
MNVAVTMFSGGRGAAGIARGMLGTPGVALSLVVNGYDNGLSTGALRRYLPGMLGPSDFRKNLLLHLDPADPARAALVTVLEHRLPGGTTPAGLAAVVEAIATRCGTFAALPEAAREVVTADLRVFARRLAAYPHGLDLADCALGNLVFAGAYLRLGRDFNAAVDACARTFGSPVRLLNVTNGENAFLTALRRDGSLLADEADIVAPQGPGVITDLFLLREPLGARRRAELEALPPAWTREVLGRERAEVTPNPRTLEAIRDADLIVYGPGTPHSSLLPSYLTPGVADAIARSRAAAKVFVVNIRGDHDIRGLSAPDLVDRTLAYLGDPRNARRLVTHVLSHRPARAGSVSAPDAPAVPYGVLDRGEWAGARWITADLERPGCLGVHHPERTAEALLAIRDEAALVRAR